MIFPISVICQGESRIVGRKGNVSDPDGDIVEVNFQLDQSDRITIDLIIAGNIEEGINRNYIYIIDFFEEEGVTMHTSTYPSFATVTLDKPDSKWGGAYMHSDYFPIEQDKPKTLLTNIKGSTVTITGLTADDLGQKNEFYALALSVILDEEVSIDQEIFRVVDQELSSGSTHIILVPIQTPSNHITDSSATKTQSSSDINIWSKSSVRQVTLDGKWTTSNEWADATKLNFDWGYFYIKDDEEYLYFLIDFLRPEPNMSGSHWGSIAIDTLNDKSDRVRSDDFFISVKWPVYYMMLFRNDYQGNDTGWEQVFDYMMQEHEFGFGINGTLGIGTETSISIFEEPLPESSPVKRAIYEFFIPKKIFEGRSEIGFYASTGMLLDYPETIEATLPNEAMWDDPSTWATLSFATKSQTFQTPTPNLKETPEIIPMPSDDESESSTIAPQTPTSSTPQINGVDYTPFYIIAFAIMSAGAFIAFAIYRKKNIEQRLAS